MVTADASPTEPGRRWAIASLVCAAAVAPMYVVGWAVGTGLGALLDVDEGEMLTTAGTAGWVAGIGLVLLLVAPQVAGIVVGLRARRLGAGRLAVAGVAANAAIGGYLLLTSAAGLLLS